MAGAGPALAWNSPAPDIVLYCPPALNDAMRLEAAAFGAAKHVKVHIFVAPPDGLRGLIAHRARADVLVADASTVGALAATRLVRPDSMVELGQDPFVIVGGAGVIASGDARQLVASHPTILPDPTTAASFAGAEILHAALPDTKPQREIGVADTPTVLATVKQDGNVIGLVNASEAHGPGIAASASLAVAPTHIQGALVANGQSANAAALLAFMAGPQGKAILHAAGLEAMP
jgi:ABC-type molybdate transport system substrate-binding protein